MVEAGYLWLLAGDIQLNLKDQGSSNLALEGHCLETLASTLIKDTLAS